MFSASLQASKVDASKRKSTPLEDGGSGDTFCFTVGAFCWPAQSRLLRFLCAA
jgi:hypothetical protein